MAQKSTRKQILIVACGNPDAGDDGFGHAVAESLRADPVPGITLVEAGVRPADLLDYAVGYDVLIIVDAVYWPGEKPGSLVDMDWYDPARPVLQSEKALSTHGISLGRQIDLGYCLGMLPSSIGLVGVTIVRAQIGCSMTEAVRRSIPEAVRVIKQHAGHVPAMQ